MDEFREFRAARDFARRLELSSAAQWFRWASGDFGDTVRPADIPSNPQRIYEGRGWRSWRDWLGTANRAPYRRRFLSYTKARVFMQHLGLATEAEHRRWAAGKRSELPPRPANIPSNPAMVYRGRGWVGIHDYLGVEAEATVKPGSKMRTFAAAREFAQELGLRGQVEWWRWCRGEMADRPPRPAGIPVSPQAVYRKRGWLGWGDFLGTGNIARHRVEYRDFETARLFARSLGLCTQTEWRKWLAGGACPADIPRRPDVVYRATWQGWPDWLHRAAW